MIKRESLSSGDGLRSMAEICGYTKYSDELVRRLIENENFPAVKIGDAWESSKDLIDAWRQNYIRANLCQ